MSKGGVEFGCDYCADDLNRWFGHLEQLGSDEGRQVILLRCPRCGALYEDAPTGVDRTRCLLPEEAPRLFPGAL